MENIPQSATFCSPYDYTEPRNGQTVTVHGELYRGTNHLFDVTFPDGYRTEVWPEEIGLLEETDPTDRYI